MQQDLWAKMTAKPGHPPIQTVATPQDQESDTDRRLAQLKELGELRASGVLTDDEFEREKARILA
jgi:hypothetical protein